jgi:hypothetical protein
MPGLGNSDRLERRNTGALGVHISHRDGVRDCLLSDHLSFAIDRFPNQEDVEELRYGFTGYRPTRRCDENTRGVGRSSHVILKVTPRFSSLHFPFSVKALGMAEKAALIQHPVRFRRSSSYTLMYTSALPDEKWLRRQTQLARSSSIDNGWDEQARLRINKVVRFL